MLVLDATPLIYLAKAGEFGRLSELGDDLVLPNSVYREVVEGGEARGETDATRIRQLIEDGGLRVVDAPSTSLAKRLASNDRIHEAERDVLVLAQARGGEAILDERYGRQVAEVEGIAHGGTVSLLIRLIKADALTAEDARDTLDRMIGHGWYCSTELYARILRTLEGLEDRG